MREKNQELTSELKEKLIDFSHHIHMPGINTTQNLECLIKQIVDSVRRIKYISLIKENVYKSAHIADPNYSHFDPIKAAIWHKNQGNIDEAFWLIFLFVHFGKHAVNEWKLVKDIYGQLGSGQLWDWEAINNEPNLFRAWLNQNQEALKGGRFGNHRKYESLDALKATGTASILASYVNWVSPYGSHTQMINAAINSVGDDEEILFNHLYKSMGDVIRFGRTAKFDYLTMIGKLDLAKITPGSAYLNEATGPRRGASLLFEGSTKAKVSAKELEAKLRELNAYLELYYGCQVLEDSLCNWQKDPTTYVYFKG
ncbi:alpha-glutamyl/putrescinyl thymine pyrophosphorylase clade 3 protein [Spirosoma lituiforme]